MSDSTEQDWPVLVRAFLQGGPVDAARTRIPRWNVTTLSGEPVTPPTGVPQHVWLCRIEWPLGEWRVRLEPEIMRGRSALYWLEQERDGSPRQTPDDAYCYAYVPDDEVEEYVPGASEGVRGIEGLFGGTSTPKEGQ